MENVKKTRREGEEIDAQVKMGLQSSFRKSKRYEKETFQCSNDARRGSRKI